MIVKDLKKGDVIIMSSNYRHLTMAVVKDKVKQNAICVDLDTFSEFRFRQSWSCNFIRLSHLSQETIISIIVNSDLVHIDVDRIKKELELYNEDNFH